MLDRCEFTATKGSMAEPSAAATKPIPEALRTLKRWIRWRRVLNPGGRPTRKPEGSTRDRNNRRTFAEVEHDRRDNEQGIGLVFSEGIKVEEGWLIALDLDACYFDGVPTPWALEVIEAFDASYTEISPSGYGLRIFLIVQEKPDPVPLINVPVDTPIDKKAQLQVFGCGPAGYVTVSGNRMPGSGDRICVVLNLQWIFKRFGGVMAKIATDAMPVGTGEMPSVEEIAAGLRGSDRVRALVDGDWESLKHESASEGFAELATAVLKAANGHVPAAAEFLIGATAYGRGDVESMDPSRYGRDDWVTADLCRIHGKIIRPQQEAFDDGFDAAAWEPPAVAPVIPADVGGWFVQAADFVEMTRESRFLYHNLLPERGVAQLFGDPASGKTAVAMSLAVHVAAGLDWMGFELDRPGRVFYIAGEGMDGLGRRLEAQLREADPVMSLRDLAFHMSTRPGTFTLAENREAWVAAVRGVLDDYPDESPALIVLDTQVRNFGPGNENSTEDMSAFIAEIDAMVREVGALVLLVHHTGHDNKGRGRGSSVMVGALDAVFEVSNPEGTKTVFVEPRKAKDWELPKPFEGSLRGVTLGTDAKGRPLTAVTFSPDKADPAEVFHVQSTEIDYPRLINLLRKIYPAPVSYKDLSASIRHPIRQIRRQIDLAEKQGHIEVLGTPKRRVYRVLTEEFTSDEELEGDNTCNEV